MKKFLGLIPLCLFLLLAPARAGSEMTGKEAVRTTLATNAEQVPLDIFTFEQGYVFQSDLNRGGSLGQQDEIQNEIEYGHRIRLSGNLYVRLGFAYDRYDFGSTSAPVPNHLQSAAGIIGFDYMHGADVAAFFQIRPGFYTQNDFGISSFDAPITLGRIFVLQEDKLYIFAGAYASFLRGSFPVLPLAGVIWTPCDQFRVMGVLPDPRIIYSPRKNLDIWFGGELVGGSYRTDKNDNIQPHKLSGAQVDFAEYRAGAGIAYTITPNVTFNVGAGISFLRQFAFDRAGENYRTDPAPYVRVTLKAAF